MPALGGEPRKIVENAESGDWSPDGKRIVFARLEGQGELENSTLYIADADGSQLQILLQVKKTEEQEIPNLHAGGRGFESPLSTFRFGFQISLQELLITEVARLWKHLSAGPSDFQEVTIGVPVWRESLFPVREHSSVSSLAFPFAVASSC